MPKKTSSKGDYNFFFLNHVLLNTEKTSKKNIIKRTPNIFHILIYILLFGFPLVLSGQNVD
jgi:hypothetical protein